MGELGVLGPPPALLGWQRAFGVDLILEASEERSASGGSVRGGVDAGVQDVGRHTGPQLALLWSHDRHRPNRERADHTLSRDPFPDPFPVAFTVLPIESRPASNRRRIG